MTALVFVIALVAAYIHWATRGWYVWDGTTIYVAAFVATLTTAAVFAILSRERRALIALGVLIVNFAGSHWGWASSDPLLNQAILDTATAAWFVFLGSTRWEFGIGAVYLLSVLSAVLTQFGWIPSGDERPPIFLAWSFPDITSICGHMASILLGLGAGDWGKRVREGAWKRPAILGASSTLALRLFRIRSER